MKNFPKSIYLQVDSVEDDYNEFADAWNDDNEEITWSVDKIFPNDVHYILAPDSGLPMPTLQSIGIVEKIANETATSFPHDDWIRVTIEFSISEGTGIGGLFRGVTKHHNYLRCKTIYEDDE